VSGQAAGQALPAHRRRLNRARARAGPTQADVVVRRPVRERAGGTEMVKDGKIKISKKKEKSVRVHCCVGAAHV
jgi:hypothetical protein